MENAIQLILAQMQSVLNSPQLKRLKTVLTEILPGGKTIKRRFGIVAAFSHRERG